MTVSHTLNTEVQHSVELCAAFYLHRVRVQDLEGADATGASWEQLLGDFVLGIGQL